MNSKDDMDPFILFSMRQVVGGCLDWVQEALKPLLAEFIQHGNPPMNHKFDLNMFEKWDLSTLINFFLACYTEVTMHIKMIDPGLGRTLLFMIKSHRNYWAHQRDFNYRDVYRLCDAIELLFENLDDKRLNDLYEKVVLVRKQACLYMAKEIESEKEQKKLASHSMNQHTSSEFHNYFDNGGNNNSNSGMKVEHEHDHSYHGGYDNNSHSQQQQQQQHSGQYNSNNYNNGHSAVMFSNNNQGYMKNNKNGGWF